MPIQVKFYGDLREKFSPQDKFDGAPISKNVEADEINTIFDILKKYSIEEPEISHIFVNSKYCGPGKQLNEGDRIGLFPKNMALNFIEIVKNNLMYITLKLFADLQKHGPAKSNIELPKGSTLKSALKRYNIDREKTKLIILVNRIPCYKNDFVLKDGDVVAVFPPLAGG